MAFARWLKQRPKLQFALTGASGWVLGLLIMRTLIGEFGWTVKSGTAAMLIVTFAYTYSLNRYVTWRDREVHRLSVVKFVLARAATAYATWLGVAALVGLHYTTVLGSVHINYEMDYLQANTLCVALATLINWAGCDQWVFQPGLLPSSLVTTGQYLNEALEALSWKVKPPTGRHTQRHLETATRPTLMLVPESGTLSNGKVLPNWPEAKVRIVRRLPAQLRLTLRVMLGAAIATAIGYGCLTDLRVTAITVVALYTLPMLVIQARTLALTLHFWRTPEHADDDQDRFEEYEPPTYTIDILVAARHEEGVLYRNLQRMMHLDYPQEMFRVLVGIADDDLGTLDEARRAQSEFPDNIKVHVITGEKKSKPLTLLAMLPHVESDLVFWLDAESAPADLLLQDFNTRAVRHPNVGVWQGGVQLMNIHAPRRTKPDGSQYHRINPLGWRWGSAWRGHNCVEYRVWFMSRMRYQADKGFITLGGNTVLMWSHLVKQVKWRDVPTEDCDQGVRLSLMGVPIRSFYLGDLVTKEETPISLPAWTIQRRRWILGFIEVLARNDWRALPTLRQRALAYELLSLPFWQAISGIMTPVALITAMFFKAPVIIVLWTYMPAALAALYAIVLKQAFKDFCQEFGLPVTRLYLLRFVLFLPIYQLALSIAALRALKRFVTRDYDWGITQHRGEHLDAAPEAA